MATVLNGRYELGEVIGEGGMAITHLANDRLLGRRVAVKVLREHLAEASGFLSRFRSEAQAAARLSHENIAAIYDTGSDQGRHYIVMEYVPGENLKERLRREGPLPVAEAVEIAMQACWALQAAHRAGLVHRDIKAHNLLLTAEGRVKVADFGVARALEELEETTQQGVTVGSPHYLAPEQARGGAVGAQADLYSLGVVLFEMLAGRLPFEAGTPLGVIHQQLYDQPPRLRGLRPEVPPDLAAIVARCLEKEPARRFASAAELLEALLACREQLPEEGVSRVGRERWPLRVWRDCLWRVARAPGWSALLAAVVLLAGVGTAAILTARGAARVPLVVVPRLIGHAPQDARKLLEACRLVYREEKSVTDARVPAGRVARQRPAAETRAARGTEVRVAISLGPGRVIVPIVTQMQEEQARRYLQEAGLAVGKVTRDYHETMPEGIVAATFPPAGQSVRPGSRVDLVVSKGKPPVLGPPPALPPPPGTQVPGKEFSFRFSLPADMGPGRKNVVVELEDSKGKRRLYAEQHAGGQQLPTLRFPLTEAATLRVLLEGSVIYEENLRPGSGSE
jgi:serine/threonine-protein kinase